MNSIKSGRVVLVLVLSMMSYGCRCGDSGACDDSRPGAEGGCCRADGCNAGLVCDGPACRACGGRDGRCCYPMGSAAGTCGAGLTCVSLPGGGDQCQSCGHDGELCCEGMGTPACGTGLSCSSTTGRCQNAGAACAPGATSFVVGVTDRAQCAVRTISITTDSFAHALDCAATMLQPNEVVVTGAPVGPITNFTFCVQHTGQGRMTVPVQAFSEYDGRVCACGGPDHIIGCNRQPGPCM